MTQENKIASGGIDLDAIARRVLVSQIVIAALVAMIFSLIGGLQSGIAALYGGMVAVTLAWLLKRRVDGVVKAAGSGKSMMLLYLGVVQRFILVLALFALALGVLKLDPLACIVGFGLGQLGYVISRVLHKE